MSNVLYSRDYEVLTELMAEWRRAVGVSQRELARRMRRSQTHVHKMESRQRRVELIEFCRYAEALGLDAERAFAEFLARARFVRAA